ncbi:MAG: HlyD family secretion protein [Calditrichaceae bacterium]|nr:HlyD family secretion protein [Calditrichaceae bacterium]
MSVMTGCVSDNQPDKTQAEDDPAPQFVPVLNLQNLPVRIPVSGDLTPWKQAEIAVPFESKIIASLVEPLMEVKQNDVLVSLWRLSQKYEYTPINLIAPFDGIVTHYKYAIGQVVPANKEILTVINYDNYKLTAVFDSRQIDLIKRLNKAFIKMQKLELEGYVAEVLPGDNQVSIHVPGADIGRVNFESVTGYIEAGLVSGTFIPDKYFKDQDTLRVRVDREIELTLKRFGLSDSLALIYPNIPDQERIFIVSTK